MQSYKEPPLLWRRFFYAVSQETMEVRCYIHLANSFPVKSAPRRTTFA